jgi:hypothetical protein
MGIVASDDSRSEVSAHPTERWWSWTVVLTLLVASAAIGFSDWMLQRYENVVGSMQAGADSSPIFLPFSQSLHDQVALKTEWLNLLTRQQAAEKAGNAALLIATDFEIDKFISDHIDPSDSRRMNVLLSLVDSYPDDPRVVDAYASLLQQAQWQPLLVARRSQFAQSVVIIAAKDPKTQTDTLSAFAPEFQDIGDSADELLVLRALRGAAPISFRTVGLMRSLAALLPPIDADRPALEADLQRYSAYRAHIDALAAAFYEYARVAPAPRATQTPPAQSAPTESPPTWTQEQPINPFAAAYDVDQIRNDLIAGRFADALALRNALGKISSDDVAECDDALANLPQLRNNANKTAPIVPPVIPYSEIALERFRGLVSSHSAAAADAMNDPETGKPLDASVKPLLAASQGHFARSAAVCAFTEVDPSSAPAEVSQALAVKDSGVPWLRAQLALTGTASAMPADIHSKIDLWIASDNVAIECWADDPRPSLPEPKVKMPNASLESDESFEISIDPDGGGEGYWQLSANRAATVSSGGFWARSATTGQPGALHQSLNVTATPLERDGGWGELIVAPRLRLFPPLAVLRNRIFVPRLAALRRRWVTENNQPVLQTFSWPGHTPNASSQPAHFGWTIWN